MEPLILNGKKKVGRQKLSQKSNINITETSKKKPLEDVRREK
jgi:hypothetical protein